MVETPLSHLAGEGGIETPSTTKGSSPLLLPLIVGHPYLSFSRKMPFINLSLILLIKPIRPRPSHRFNFSFCIYDFVALAFCREEVHQCSPELSPFPKIMVFLSFLNPFPWEYISFFPSEAAYLNGFSFSSFSYNFISFFETFYRAGSFLRDRSGENQCAVCALHR